MCLLFAVALYGEGLRIDVISSWLALLSSTMARRSQRGVRRVSTSRCSGRIIQRIGLERTRGFTGEVLMNFRKERSWDCSVREKRWTVARGMVGALNGVVCGWVVFFAFVGVTAICCVKRLVLKQEM